MSIIYDALKKAEGLNIGPEGKLDKGRKSKFKGYLIYVLVACFGFFIANMFFGLFKPVPKAVEPLKIIQAKPQDTLTKNEPQTDDVTEIAPKDIREGLVLNGVFFSEEEGYALINNRIVKEGDMVGGLTVKRIDLEAVELESAGSVIKLSAK